MGQAQLAQAQEAQATHRILYTTEEYQQFARQMAAKYGLNEEHFLGTVTCESDWDATVQSHFYSNGKRERSFGIAQLNLDAPPTPDVTLSLALDPYWSLEYTAQQFNLGNAKKWACWKQLYG